MPSAPHTPQEAQRLRSLVDLAVLDTPAEEQFDALVSAAALLCGVPVSLLNLVDADRQWSKARVGADDRAEVPRSASFCAHAIGQDGLFEVVDATRDPRFADNPGVTGAPGIRFYAAMPLQLADGMRVGTLCVLDTSPRSLDDRQRAILAQLARAAARALETRRDALLLAASDRRKNLFLATLAHELRNPLAPLSHGLALLRIPAAADSREEVQEMMSRQLRHLVKLVDELLDLARMNNGKIQLKRSRVEIDAIIQAAIEISTPLIEARRHELVTDIGNDPISLDADANRLAQVLANLIVNAAKYTPEGGRIEVGARSSGRHVVLTVSDNGMGIPDDRLTEIFEVFSQVRQGAGAEHGGLGIGLAIVRTLVQLHGGSVSAASRGANAGSTFEVRLPLPEPATAAA